ncbi:SepM family pheromone-processing serine protease [Chryseomicrobium sp. FSL W7-1435]|uniref:SepM family pheromone-processing serine protease n=1 Tax=Chryseomicrobium sp. FSL W7-1435 TaxID=2921704 RepID=UPI00315A1ADB
MKRWAGPFGILAALLFLFYPLDYYISKPGGAYELSPIVEVEAKDRGDEGELRLLTIALSKATPATYIYQSWRDPEHLMKANQIRREDEDDEAYEVRQLKLMSNSQLNAIQVAYDKTGYPYELVNNGLFIYSVVKESPADGILKPGDRIQAIDGSTDVSETALQEFILTKDVGDTINLTIDRDGEKQQVTITLGSIPELPDRPAVGISYQQDQEITTEREVVFQSEEIGGPSAGLMFTLEIMNQLVEGDLTKGYRIAGTGEIAGDGTVGRIGGIDLKVVAAANEEVDFMFAPDDVIAADILEQNPDLQSNYQDALDAKEELGLDIEIVPVKTIDDALDYLEKLPPKS